MNKIYVVNEDNHGTVSYWDNEKDAQNEALKIIRKMYVEDEDLLASDEYLLDNYTDVVFVEPLKLNKSWIG